MRSSSLLLGLVATVALAFVTTNLNNMQTKLYDGEIPTYNEQRKSLKKSDVLGTYIVKNDKNTKLTLNNDGTYLLVINVCEKYITLSGVYELTDTKLKLRNSADSYEDLYGNEELSFTIVDEKSIKSDESLVCTTQETLFEK